MTLPTIGEVITTAQAVKLCKHYEFDYLVKRIEISPEKFKDWKFDGASMIPDLVFSKIFRIPHLLEIALRHNLKYAYGEPDNKDEKRKADREFRQELVNDGAPRAIAALMFFAVSVFGNTLIKTSFSWGFARK